MSNRSPHKEYVGSFVLSWSISKAFIFQQGPELGVRVIFEHARSHAPCILVIEDLDSMVTDNVRSFFLNELDGLVSTSSVLSRDRMHNTHRTYNRVKMKGF